MEEKTNCVDVGTPRASHVTEDFLKQDKKLLLALLLNNGRERKCHSIKYSYLKKKRKKKDVTNQENTVEATSLKDQI